MAIGAFTTSRRLHMRLLSTLGDLRASCAVLARRWLAFHITFATFAARTRLFSTLAHLPLKYTNPLLTYPSFLFFFPYRVSTIAQTPAFGYLLFAGTFVRRSDYHHYSSRTHLRDTAKRPRDDTAFLRARARVHCVDESTRVVSDRNVKIIALQFTRNRLEYPPRVVIVENPLL